MFLIDTNAINRQGKTFFTGAVATGGTITTDGDYKVHTFNSSGNFQVTSLGDGPVLEYLVIAGGGAGAGCGNGGAGGTGGPGYAVIVEPAVCRGKTAPGVWQMNTVYDFVKSDNWVYNFADVDYLVVGGGGGGGGSPACNTDGAGGGAGGYRASGYGPAPLQGCTLNLKFGSYAVTVGGGGSGASAPLHGQGTTGTDSTYSTITSSGGGGGGGRTHPGTGKCAGLPGGSGGGGVDGASGGTGNAGCFPIAEGFAGGSGSGSGPA